MADRAEFSRLSSGAPSNALSLGHGKASTRIAPVLALAAGTLAGCNASQGLNPSSQRALADIYPNYTPYNPVQYAQTSGFYAGR